MDMQQLLTMTPTNHSSFVITVLNDIWCYGQNDVYELETQSDWDAAIFSYNSVCAPACRLDNQ